ncbi:MAG TPA: hypothetical protein HPP77_11855 [Candidatus Hydrogenedentes bacterium]|nr:hypothetical protein [Candidatus Hydrogenedentota bacterium]
MTTGKPTRRRAQKLVEAEGVPRTIRGEVNPEAAQAAPTSVPASTGRRSRLFIRPVITATALLLLFPLEIRAAPPIYRPSREYRTINTDIYKLTFQKNGRTDVCLVSGEPVFSNAFPMVWFEGESEPSPLDLDGRRSARAAVNDRLGRGHGMVFQKGNCAWHLRAYPTKPFYAAQVTFTNTKKKPVRVKMLLPWCVGEPHRGALSLGADSSKTAILQNGDLFRRADSQTLEIGKATSYWHAAAHNPGTGRSLIAGFLTHGAAATVIEIGRQSDANDAELDLFRAATVFDPPVEVAPRQSLDSDVLYLSVEEPTPLHGLERYAAAIAAANAGNAPESYLPLDGLCPAASDASPGWRQRTADGPPGCVEILARAVRRYYLAPYLPTSPRSETTTLPALTRDQTVAWYTGCALTGGMLPIPDLDANMNEFESAIIQRLRPPPRQPARPVDLFESERPRVWLLRFERDAGEWNVLALFNWDDHTQRIPLHFERLGLDPATYYTVYDFWRDAYRGAAQGKLEIALPPSSVSLLGLRPYQNRPMFLATDAHFTQGAMNVRSIEWDDHAKRLCGSFNVEAGTSCRYRVLFPEPYEPVGVSTPQGKARSQTDGRVLKFSIPAAEKGPIEWRAEFRTNQ